MQTDVATAPFGRGSVAGFAIEAFVNAADCDEVVHAD
jgi:hypothetical protein